MAVSRSACTERAIERRCQREVQPAQLRAQELWIDGLNVLTGVEAALAGGVLLLGCDGCLRDLASIHARHTIERHVPTARVIDLRRTIGI